MAHDFLILNPEGHIWVRLGRTGKRGRPRSITDMRSYKAEKAKAYRAKEESSGGKAMTALEPGADSSEVTSTELTDLGLTRIAYSIAISLKRLADATEEMTVIASAPRPTLSQAQIEAITEGNPFSRDGVRPFEVKGKGWFVVTGDLSSDTHGPFPSAEVAIKAMTPSTKTTSPEMAALAAKYMGLNDAEMRDLAPAGKVVFNGNTAMEQFFADIRSLAACVLAQVEPKS